MSPIDNSPACRPPSSTSTTPPSEATLNDDSIQEEVTPLVARFQNNHINTDLDEPVLDVRQNVQLPTSHETDYESSAAEDLTSIDFNNAESALLTYSRTNKLDKLKALLAAKLNGSITLDLNFRGLQKRNFSWSALHLACYFGHKDVVALLLQKNFIKEIDINIQNNSGDLPLHKAALTGRVDIVQLLLTHGSNVFIKNCDGLLAKQLTQEVRIRDMLVAAEMADKNRTKEAMFKAVDNGDLRKLQDYFGDYGSYFEDIPTSIEKNGENCDGNQAGTSNADIGSQQTLNVISQMTDDRGNTLLHIAAMRGFKAICVYLLEQGFDPYKKNNLAQTCIDLSSYQLRQLFITVKPKSNHLKRICSQRVNRFEGPLMKKVRILGWRQIYVVLENGVILLFNNRKDSMNKSRKGYKYLESATCEPDLNDIGTFNVCFSDKSRATFLVNVDQLSYYSTFRNASQESEKLNVNQVELVRQKWINSIRDHIRYSTDFIRNGLKIHDFDDDDENKNDSDITTLNHLLPIDTIKSFVQEARAHYSILERHAESLCNLVQSINSSSRSKYTTDAITSAENEQIDAIPIATGSSRSGSRLLGLIRPSRTARGIPVTADDNISTHSMQTGTITTRQRNNSLTNEFVQNDWHCILFHLRLLIESTQNTKLSMSQALALMEHQEQLRQNRIQDQDERCRILEDSLHALARDHHEMEKSISMSQLYHSAVARSMSMSTDLNEYFDAFEDFDDEKTMTPNSMPSDEDLSVRIQEMEAAEEETLNDRQPFMRISSRDVSFQREDLVAGGYASDRVGASEDDDEDDTQSNCSALTVETVSDGSYLADRRANDLQSQVGNNNILKYKHRKFPMSINISTPRSSRTRLPSPMVPRDQVSIWSILKNCIGKELSKITMPVVFNEPLTMLQRGCEGVQYTHYLELADRSNDPAERMELICAFVVAGLSANCHRIIKPFNPLLYETYEYNHELEDGSHVKAMAQQVSHHPPITAVYAESNNFIYNGSVNPKIKFWGRSIEVQPDGQCRIYLKRHNESYVFKSVSCSIHNIIVGKLWFEHHGPLDIRCVETDVRANLQFKQAGWFSNEVHRFDGVIVSGKDKETKLKYIYGKWSDYIKSVDYAEYENYMKNNPQKLFKIPDHPGEINSNGSLTSTVGTQPRNSNSINNNLDQNSVRSDSHQVKTPSKASDRKQSHTKNISAQSLDIPNSRTLWFLESQYLEEYYNFTLFTMKLNELTPEMRDTLPRTDSRLRTDVRKLEEGDLDGAANEKQRLEEKQREARARDSRFKDPSQDFLWFELKNVPFSKDKYWVYKGGYWESKCNPDRFPDIL